jgi:hypothetical protein
MGGRGEDRHYGVPGLPGEAEREFYRAAVAAEGCALAGDFPSEAPEDIDEFVNGTGEALLGRGLARPPPFLSPSAPLVQVSDCVRLRGPEPLIAAVTVPDVDEERRRAQQVAYDCDGVPGFAAGFPGAWRPLRHHHASFRNRSEPPSQPPGLVRSH